MTVYAWLCRLVRGAWSKTTCLCYLFLSGHGLLCCHLSLGRSWSFSTLFNWRSCSSPSFSPNDFRRHTIKFRIFLASLGPTKISNVWNNLSFDFPFVAVFVSSNLMATLASSEFCFFPLTLLRTIWVFGLVNQAMCGHFGSCISGIFFFLFCLCFYLLPATMVCLNSFVLGAWLLLFLVPDCALGAMSTCWLRSQLARGFCFSRPATLVFVSLGLLTGLRLWRTGLFLVPVVLSLLKLADRGFNFICL
jgi:hypothetical protein